MTDATTISLARGPVTLVAQCIWAGEVVADVRPVGADIIGASPGSWSYAAFLAGCAEIGRQLAQGKRLATLEAMVEDDDSLFALLIRAAAEHERSRFPRETTCTH